MPSPRPDSLTAELKLAEDLARAAGELALSLRESGLQVQQKSSEEDLLTQADQAASTLIVSGLRARFPADAILSEEEAHGALPFAERRVWIIDPLDGTRIFANGDDEWAVSIALCVDGEPVLGVVFAPALRETYAGAVGEGFWANGAPQHLLQPLRPPEGGWQIAVSFNEHKREFPELFPAGVPPAFVPSGSIALKLAKVAAGRWHATFTIGPRSEWDIAAGHALLRLVGAHLLRRDGAPVRYNSANPNLEQGIVAGHSAPMRFLQGVLAEAKVPSTLLAPQRQGRHVRRSDDGSETAWLELNAAGEIIASGGRLSQLDRLQRDVTRAFFPH